jgi:histone H3/H4
MKMALPENAKIAKEAKECMQECVSEFISFITSEGMTVSSLLLAGII